MSGKVSIKEDTIIRFTNVRLVKDGRISAQDLWIQNGKILNPEPVFYDQRKLADVNIDCSQMIIAPGYIELQINGGFGYDFSNAQVDMEKAIKVVSTGLVKHGVTSFCPTLVTQPASNYGVLLPRIKRGTIERGANVLGVHLEGPFISVEKKGAHPKEYIQTGPLQSIERIESIYTDLSNVSIITVAPELDSNNVIKQLAEKKSLIVSLGHSTANLSDSERAFRNGAKMITHLFNAMPLFHHRDPGLLGLLTLDNERQVYYGIIADGIHTHYSALRLAYHANRLGMVLVSDAISATGLESGIHMIGTQKIEIKENRAYVAGTDTLCGSIALLDDCVKYMRQMVGCPTVEAIECATLHPAKALGIESHKGTLNYGADADFIILNDELDVLATFVAGKCVFVSDICQLLLSILE